MNSSASGLPPKGFNKINPLILLWRPFQKFTELEAAAGLLLISATVGALIWANSPWHTAYTSFKQFSVPLAVGPRAGGVALIWFVNDVLMAFFFLVVGLEIKREMVSGELASFKKSLLPVIAAVGGMVMPALIYGLFNHGKPTAHGWGIPMATDIAFALGALMALGSRIPLSLKAFLVALAIIDDIGAIVVIAVFYSSSVAWMGLVGAVLAVLSQYWLNRKGAQHAFPYLVLGSGLWWALHYSGIHPTLSGVLTAFMIPHGFSENESEVQPLSEKIVAFLHPYVSYGILPLFALVNAGVAFSWLNVSALTHPMGLGIVLGLFLGKPMGITLFAYAAVRWNWGALPSDVSWAQIIGVGILGGIGFTMSLFLAHLGLDDETLLSGAKLSILVGSVLSCAMGMLWLGFIGQKRQGTP